MVFQRQECVLETSGISHSTLSHFQNILGSNLIFKEFCKLIENLPLNLSYKVN